jgi:hypothetical protein
MLTLDHLRLVERHPAEVTKVRQLLLENRTVELAVLHEADDSCCRREAWHTTWAAIYNALRPPGRRVVLDLEHRENPP